MAEGEVAELRRSLERAQRTSAELALAVGFGRALAQAVDVEEIGRLAAHAALEMTGAHEASLWIAAGGPQQVSVERALPVEPPPAQERLGRIEQVFETKCPLLLPGTADNSDALLYAGMPVLFGAEAVGVLEILTLPLPERAEEQLETLAGVLPTVALALHNALVLRENEHVTGQLRVLVDELQEKRSLLERQNEELHAQAEEIQAQSEELQAQNAQLFAHERELEQQNASVERLNRELVRLYQSSREQEARMRAIVDAAADGLMVVDGAQKITLVNRALETLVGCTAQELVGQTCKYLLPVHQENGEVLCDSSCPFLHAPGCGPSAMDATMTTNEGRRVWVNVAYGTIYGSDGRPATVVHAIRDVSARKEVERLKDEFLAIAAHDLRTPLTSIKGHAQLLLRRALREESRQDEVKSLEVIDQQVMRMLDMIMRLLDLTRIQMGRLELNLQPTDLTQVAERVVEVEQVTTDRHRLILRAEHRGLVGVWDRSYVERVLTNLVDNAIKYTPEGGEVTVTVEDAHVGGETGRWPGGLGPCPPGHTPGWVVVSVADEGVGISREDQAHLFERYYRVAATRREVKGLGLGLYISRGVVEAHGGRIWVESEVGGGSVFRFALPLDRP